MNDLPEIKPCPCGATPKRLWCVSNGQGYKYGNASCVECGEWAVEFRNAGYSTNIGSDDVQRLAIEAWNAAPRGFRIPETSV